MSKAKHVDLICIAITFFTLIIAVLFMFGEKIGITAIHRSESENEDAMFTSNDLNSDWSTDGATRITLQENSAEISGNGAYFNNGTVYIVYAGNYVISGTLDGSIEIDADGDDKIRLLFDGVDISSDSTAPLYIKQADKVFITLKDGSESFLKYTGGDESTKIDGAIYSCDDLTINGSGSLIITSEKLHGIVCNDTLVFAGGSIDISAGVDGVHAHDAIKICNTSVTVSAGDDGLHAGNDDKSSVFCLESGEIKITECYEGIEANIITIAGGNVSISSRDDGINANGSGATSIITISGGDIEIINQNGNDADGLDSNGSISITGGNLFISLTGTGPNSAVDYGSENGGRFTISGGTVIACGSSQMAEGPEKESTQGFIMQTVSGSAGDTLSVTDSDGNTIIEKEIPCSFTSVIISSPEISVGDTLTLNVGENSTEITVDNSTASGMWGGFDGFRPGNRGDEGGRENQENNGAQNRPDAPNGGSSKSNAEGNSGNMQNSPKDMPDMSDGNMPSPPDGGMPNQPDGSMPSLPDGNMPEMPDNENGFNPGQPGNDKNGGNGQMPGGNQNNQSGSTNGNQTGQATENNIDSSTVILLAVSSLILIIGIIIAVKKY